MAAVAVTDSKKGHAAHTQSAHEPAGLRGKFHRPIKITMLGAGSGFTPRLLNDIFHIQGADRGEIALVDIDEDRLKTMAQLIAEHTGQEVAQVENDSDRDRWFTADEAKAYGFVDHVVLSAGQVAGEGGTAPTSGS